MGGGTAAAAAGRGEGRPGGGRGEGDLEGMVVVGRRRSEETSVWEKKGRQGWLAELFDSTKTSK